MVSGSRKSVWFGVCLVVFEFFGMLRYKLSDFLRLYLLTGFSSVEREGFEFGCRFELDFGRDCNGIS